MAKKIPKVGFDLDGVILFNPIRIFRPLASFFRFIKPYLFHESAESFYFPHSRPEKLVWRELHKTSFKLATGFDEIKQLAQDQKIDAYVITSRYSFLKNDFEYWVKKMGAKKFLKGWYYNKNDMQPNLFKRTMIKKLKLDYFVEDNWGIIKKLNGSIRTIKVLWVSNFFDRNIPYKYKFFNLKQVADHLKKATRG